MKTGIKVSDAMTKKPVIATPEDTTYSCVLKMLKENVGSLLITKGDKILGFVTERDIIRKVMAKKLDPQNIKIDKVMSKEVVSIEPNRDVYDAIILMNNAEVRRLPVVNKNKTVGLITLKDIVRVNPAMLELFLHRIHIREEIEKLPNDYAEGVCEKCESQGPVQKVKGKFICVACQR